MKIKLQEKDYFSWLQGIKTKIKSAQIKSALSANSEMINLYWDIGKSIVEKQETHKWGSAVVEQLSIDPYRFDFMQLTKYAQECEIELSLMDNIPKFLLELGKGFAFLGQQYEIKINNKN